MDLLHLRYFKVVAKHEHISNAAKELHISQPSLSKVIKNLEQELDVSLFDRQGKNIVLNEYGKSFLNRVNRIFLEIDNAKNDIAQLKTNQDSTVKIAINNLSMKLLKDFLKKYPQTRLKQTMGTLDNMKSQLKDGDVDIAISSQPIVDPVIVSYPLVTEEIFLVVPKNHRLAGYTSVDLVDISDESFISFSEGFGIRNLTEEFCRVSGFEPNIVFESNIISKLLEIVSLNIGVALLPISSWSDLPETNCKFIHIKKPLCTRTIYLSHIDINTMSNASKEFKEHIMTIFKC